MRYTRLEGSINTVKSLKSYEISYEIGRRHRARETREIIGGRERSIRCEQLDRITRVQPHELIICLLL